MHAHNMNVTRKFMYHIFWAQFKEVENHSQSDLYHNVTAIRTFIFDIIYNEYYYFMNCNTPK